MPKQSAGILLYRVKNKKPEVFLGHPGGPFYKNKDNAVWTIPKGEFDEKEEPFIAAKREFKEEMDLVVEVGAHLYTTDFFQMSAFNSSHQIISIYYAAKALEPIKAPLRTKPFDFDEREMEMYRQTKETETFRFIDWNLFSSETVTLPIDKVVADLVKSTY